MAMERVREVFADRCARRPRRWRSSSVVGDLNETLAYLNGCRCCEPTHNPTECRTCNTTATRPGAASGRRNFQMTLKLPIYMDNHSTTPVDPRVLEAMLPYFTRELRQRRQSRNHVFGWTAEKAVEKAREQVGALIGASGKEIVWTSGATESNNLAIKGAAEFYKEKGNHIITGETEHKAMLDTCKRLEKEGCEVTYLPVEQDGRVSREQVVRRR